MIRALMNSKELHELVIGSLRWGVYGGDEAIYEALFMFLSAIPEKEGRYSYSAKDLSTVVGDPAAWMIIYKFFELGWLGYGVSPRFGWLEGKGEDLRRYIIGKNMNQFLSEIFAADSEASSKAG